MAQIAQEAQMNYQPQVSEGDNPMAQIAREAQGTIEANPELPDNITEARQHLGSTDFNGLCERFVEKTTLGKSGVYPSAKDAWENYYAEGKGTTDLEKARPGDIIFFQPDVSNDGYGHTGVLSGNGSFLSATDDGVQEMSLTDWQNMTKQQIQGIVPLSAIRGSN